MFHVYECEICVVTFAVEQACENQDDVVCPLCQFDGEAIRDVGAGEMKIIHAENMDHKGSCY